MSDREDGYVLSKSPCHLLHRVQQLAADRFSVSDITLRQFTVLAAVSSRAGQTQTDLVNATGIDRSTLADMILRMEERGLLTRGRSAADGRAKSVGLTANGRSALASATPRARQADDAIMAALPRSKRSPFLETLRTLVDATDAPALEMKRETGKTRKPARAAKKPRKAAAVKRTARR